jgi:hypothetical protein
VIVAWLGVGRVAAALLRILLVTISAGTLLEPGDDLVALARRRRLGRPAFDFVQFLPILALVTHRLVHLHRVCTGAVQPLPTDRALLAFLGWAIAAIGL